MIAQQHISDLIADLPGHARVWIYQSSRAIAPDEVSHIVAQSEKFLQQWNAHGAAMDARAAVVYNRFLILATDEQSVQASGCSIDSSVHFVQTLGKSLCIDFFDRLTIAYRDESGAICTLSMAQFQEEIKRGSITEDTLVFNNLINNVGDLRIKWEIPASQSWHIRLFR